MIEKNQNRNQLENVSNLRPISDAPISTIKQDKGVLLPFGCTLKYLNGKLQFNAFRETNLFLTQEADGILGLGVNTNCSYEYIYLLKQTI